MNILKSNEQIEEINNTYCVYMHTTPSGKKYVGISKNKAMQRWDCGRGYQSNTHFFNAIMKYGWINIKHEILYENLSKQEAKNIEIELIKEYDLTNRAKGYNKSHGGDLGSSSLEKPIYMYDKNTGDFLKSFNSANEAERWLGKSGSNSVGRHCSENDFHTNHGYLWRYEYVPKIDIIDSSRVIYLYDGLTLNFIKEYKTKEGDIEYLGEKYRKYEILNKCNYKKYRYKKLYCCFKEDVEDLFLNYLCNADNYQIVLQIEIETNNIIKCFHTYKDASRETGVPDLDIGAVCIGKQKTAKGYKWKSVGIGHTNYVHGNLTVLKKILSQYEDKCGLSQIVGKLENKHCDAICIGEAFIKEHIQKE